MNGATDEFKELMERDPAAARADLVRRLDELKAQCGSLAIDAHRAGDEESRWFALATKAHLERAEKRVRPLSEEEAVKSFRITPGGKP